MELSLNHASSSIHDLNINNIVVKNNNKISFILKIILVSLSIETRNFKAKVLIQKMSITKLVQIENSLHPNIVKCFTFYNF